MQEDGLLDLLEQSRTWNESHGLTGMLLYIEGRFITQREGRFMQVLEGSEQEVIGIFKNIQVDHRHQSLIVLQQGAIVERSFHSWKMGFKSMDLEAYNKADGYFNLDDDFLKSGELQKSSIPLDFLKSFYEINQES